MKRLLSALGAGAVAAASTWALFATVLPWAAQLILDATLSPLDTKRAHFDPALLHAMLPELPIMAGVFIVLLMLGRRRGAR